MGKSPSRFVLVAVIILSALFGYGATPSQAFTIVEPTQHAALTSGQTLTVRVKLGEDIGIVQVRYYWYGEWDEVLVGEEETSAKGTIVKPVALISNASQEPPFGGKLRVPQKAIGIMRLLAVAEVSRGRLNSGMVFDEILVEVKPEAALTSIDFDCEKPLRFGSAGREAVYASIDSLGKIAVIPTVGYFADGAVRPIRLPSTGTTYRSSDESIVKVFSNGLLQLIGNGRAMITASNQGVEGILDIYIRVPDEPNETPQAEAGPDRTIKSGQRVLLNGLESFDPEGGGLRYHWSQTRGSKIPLLDLNMAKASFQAPEVSGPKLFQFRLRVTDNHEADSFPDHVNITVEP